MQLAILGASGRLGSELVTAALSRGHVVRVLTRNPRRIKRANEYLTVFQGDLETGEGLEPFLVGCRRIVWTAHCARPVRAMQNLLAAIGPRSIDRLVFMSWLGVGESATQARRSSGIFSRALAKLRPGMFEGLADAEEALRQTKVPRIVLRATKLTDAPAGGDVVVMGPSGIPPLPVGRADLARFILLRVLEEPGWNETEVTVGLRRG